MTTSENKRGSDCSGTDGNTGRILTLANTSTTQAGGFMVFVNGLSLVLTTEYTVSHLSASSTVTFVNVIMDTDYIVVIYNQTGAPSSSAVYTSYTSVYAKTGLSTSEVASATVDLLILDAEAELEALTGRKFTNGNSVTEYLSVRDKDIIGNAQTTFKVRFWPIQSVTICNLLDSTGAASATLGTLTSAQISAETYYTTDYWLDTSNDTANNLLVANGIFKLKTRTLSKGTQSIKVAYTHGYNSVPQVIQNLATCLAGIRTWLAFMGASYNRLNSYQISETSVNKGDFYQRGQQNIQMLTDEANRLLDRIGRKQRSIYFSSGDDR